MAEDVPFLPGLSPVCGKPVRGAFDGGHGRWRASAGGDREAARLGRALGAVH